MLAERLVDRPERIFQLWAFSVGMKRMLLRSTKNATFPTRIDVYFQCVAVLQIPTLLDGLVMTEADHELAARIEGETGVLPDDRRFFAVETAGRIAYPDRLHRRCGNGQRGGRKASTSIPASSGRRCRTRT